MKAEVSRTVKKNGTIAIVVTLDGVIIGKRTSKNTYRYAAVYRENRNTKIANIEKYAYHCIREARKYEAIAAMTPEEFDIYNKKNARSQAYEYDISWGKECYSNGNYKKWADNIWEADKKLKEEVNQIKADASPLKITIESWHSRRDLVVENHPCNADYIGALDIETGEIN